MIFHPFYELAEVTDGGFEHAHVEFAGYVLVQAAADALAVTHLAKYAAVGRGDAFDGVQGVVGVKVHIAGGVVVKIDVLRGNLAVGGELTDLVEALAFAEAEPQYPKTMGGKVWWREIMKKKGFRIQQNLISGHFRLLDKEDHRLMASFELERVLERMKRELQG